MFSHVLTFAQKSLLNSPGVVLHSHVDYKNIQPVARDQEGDSEEPKSNLLNSS